MKLNRSNIYKAFLVVSLVAASVGFSDLFGSIASGLGRAFGAVFFCLFLISYYLRIQKTDEELAHPALGDSAAVRAEPT